MVKHDDVNTNNEDEYTVNSHAYTLDDFPESTEDEKGTLFYNAVNLDEKYIPEPIIKEFWAYFNRNALTSIITDNELVSMSMNADIFAKLQKMKYSRRELENNNLITRYFQVPDAILLLLSRARKGKIYEYSVKSISVSESIEKREQENKKRWFAW